MNQNSPQGDNLDRHHNGPCPDEAWRKSSFSMNGGDCVEVTRFTDGRVGVRDSKMAGGPVLRFKVDAWATFIGDIRSARTHHLEELSRRDG